MSSPSQQNDQMSLLALIGAWEDARTERLLSNLFETSSVSAAPKPQTGVNCDVESKRTEPYVNCLEKQDQEHWERFEMFLEELRVYRVSSADFRGSLERSDRLGSDMLPLEPEYSETRPDSDSKCLNSVEMESSLLAPEAASSSKQPGPGVPPDPGINTETPTGGVWPTSHHLAYQQLDFHGMGSRGCFEDAGSQPAKRFEDSLSLELVKRGKFEPALTNFLFKNNLAAVSEGYPGLLFCASGSEICVFNVDLRKGTLGNKPMVSFDTKPQYTYAADIMAAVWQHYPHSINFVKVATFLNKEVLVVAVDNGKVLIYNVDEVVDKMHTYASKKQYVQCLRHDMKVKMNIEWNLNVFRVEPNVQFRMEKSVWGIDVCNKYSMIAVSDNSKKVSLFYYATEHSENALYCVSSQPLAANVPDIAFIDDNSLLPVDVCLERCVAVQVSTGAILGELVTFEFVMDKVSGPRNKLQGREDLFERVRFREPRILHRIVLKDQVWTTHFVHGSHFKQVSSLAELTGDYSVDEAIVMGKLCRQNSILDVESDPIHTGDVGLSSKMCHLAVPLANAANAAASAKITPLNTNGLKDDGATSDTFKRIKQLYDDYYLHKQRGRSKQVKSINGSSYWEAKVTPPFDSNYLVVTTAKSLGLFHCNRLICNSSCDNLFCVAPDNVAGDRLSFSHVIPELSCAVVATLTGKASVFRLTTYRGIYSFRQEYLFPTALLQGSSGTDVNYLTGMAVRPDPNTHVVTKFFIHLIYNDGLHLTYELRSDLCGSLIADVVV